MAHTKVSRLEERQIWAASKKPSVEVEIDECRKFISRAERRIRELDTEREKEHVSLVEAQERLRAIQVPRDPRHSPKDTSDGALNKWLIFCSQSAMLWRDRPFTLW